MLLSMGSEISEGLTIGQAAKVLKVSTKTIRRRIDQGIISFELINGKYGNEYRITGLSGSPLPLNNAREPEKRDKRPEQTADTSPTQPVDKGLAQALDSSLAQALDMVNKLQQENRDLAGALGVAQEKVRNLESQALLYIGNRKPWWKRLFRSTSSQV
jgi:excisionase family DNA binding protein